MCVYVCVHVCAHAHTRAHMCVGRGHLCVPAEGLRASTVHAGGVCVV